MSENSKCPLRPDMAMHPYDDRNGFFTEAGHVGGTFSFPGQRFNSATRSGY